MKKVLCIIIVIALIFTMSAVVFAEPSIQSDTNKITSLVEQFFTVREQHFLSNVEIETLYQFFDESVLKRLNNDTTLKVFEYERLIRQNRSAFIANDSFKIYIEEININGNEACILASEYYEYENIPGDNDISSRCPSYSIKCVKGDSDWKIESITVGNEISFIVNCVESIFDVATLFDFTEDVPKSDPTIDAAHREREMGLMLELNQNNTRSTNAIHYYSGVASVAYASTYSSNANNTSSYNSNFLNYFSSDSDCQNFVSQCIWAGFYGTNTSTAINNKYTPMITTSGREWWATSSSATTSWVNCEAFANYVAAGGSSVDGLYGSVGSKGSIANGYAGDIIQVYNGSGYHHSYIIDQATGTSGSRTLSNFYVTAHTTNRKHELLSNIFSSSNNLRIIAITGNRY